MCGIVGLAQAKDFSSIPAMLSCLHHRGPDDEGVFKDADVEVAIAMRRLSIVDLGAGHQPMSNEDDSLWIVCNGEIFNAPQLRQRLESQGHPFKTSHSDTEVLLHLYEEKGESMLSDLNGMFAFVIYDKKRRRLFGARDRMGIKPLYYSKKDRRFAFASELKCLLALPWVSKDIRGESLYHYTSLQFVPAPHSIFQDIEKIPAGHCFSYDLAAKDFQLRRYWDISFEPDTSLARSDWQARIRSTMEEAVERWTLSDVPIACSLSGGLDSAALVGLLAKKTGKKIRTYTLGFHGEEQRAFSELELARTVARKWDTEHHELVVDPSKLLETLNDMVWHLEEPYAGGLPSWYVYEFIGRDCKVAMTGTGGDELFGNYGKWLNHEHSPLYLLLKRIKNVALGAHPPRELVDMFRYPHGHFYHRYLTDAAKDSFVFDRNNGGFSTEALLEKVWRASKSDNPRDAVPYVDFQMQLPEEFLHVTDSFSMAHSVEARVPFLDHTLVELVFKVPAAIRTSKHDRKGLLKDVVRDLLPQELLSQPKRGFILPLSLWTRRELKPLIEDSLNPSRLRQQGLFSAKLYDALVVPHMKGERDHTEQIWTLTMFQQWYNRFFNAAS
jgi:asparagine synthase (glutamine-hydrolysing)